MIRSERDGAVVTITIDRQERRSAVDAGACIDMQTALTEAVGTGVRVPVVTGVGDLAVATAWAAEIAALAPLTIAGHKLAINRLESATGDDADVEAAVRRAWGSADLAEGMAAFRDRRPAQFSGR